MREIKYITTCTGMKIQENFFMRKTFWHKGWVWIFSVVDGYSLGTEHETGDETNKGGRHYVQRFRHEHEVKLQEIYNQAIREEAAALAQEGKIIDDVTTESKQILNQTNRLQPGDLQN